MRRHPTAVAVVALLALTACGSTSSSSTTPAGSAAGSASVDSAAGPVTVFAASSLKEAFTQIGTDYEAVHPGAKVTFNFGASRHAGPPRSPQRRPADVFAQPRARRRWTR